MKIVIDLSEEEIERLQAAVGLPDDPGDEDEIIYAVHTLIAACM